MNLSARIPLLLSAILMLFASSSIAQTTIYNGRKVALREPNPEIIALIDNILSYAGLDYGRNFDVYEADIDNAVAKLVEEDKGMRRLILYDPKFMAQVSETAETNWAALAVMAHEIGHHLKLHQLRNSATRQEKWNEELEADAYAGFIIGMMGASEVDAFSFCKGFSAAGSDTHPPRAHREKAARSGWSRAQHVRTKILKGNGNTGAFCPIIRLEDPALTRHSYAGTVGRAAVSFTIGWLLDGTIRGQYSFDNKPGTVYRLIGRQESDGQIRIEEFLGCEVTAKLTLSRAFPAGMDTLTGKMSNSNGTEAEITLTRQHDDKARARRIQTFAGFGGSWLCNMAQKTGYGEQVYNYSITAFPSKWVQEHSEAGFRITSIAGASADWMVAMSKDTKLTEQRILGPGPIPETEIKELTNQGYRITGVAGYNKTWVFVMSKGTGFGNQSYSPTGEWPGDWVKKGYDEDYYVTSIAGDEGCWLLVMTQKCGLTAQSVYTGDGFPSDWIRQRWKAGFAITAASGYHNWRVVMSKGAPHNNDHFLRDQQVPKAFIQAQSEGAK